MFDIVVTYSGNLLSGQVGPRHLSPNSVWSGHVGSGAVGGQLSIRSVASGSIGPLDHASGSVLSGHAGSGAFQGFFGATRHVASGTLGGSDFGSGAVMAGTVGSGAIVSGNVGSGQIGNFHVASGAVTSGRIGMTGTPSSGYVFQADFSWVAPTGGTWVRLSTATASDSATIDFTLPAGYVAFKVVLSHVAPATDAVELWLRTSTDGGLTYDAGASDYQWSVGNFQAAASAQGGDTADSEITLNRNTLGNASNELSSYEVLILNPSAAKYCQVLWTGRATTAAGVFEALSGAGQRLTAADVDAIRFLFSSGNIASGVFSLFGMKK